MPANTGFWRNVAVIGLVHVVVLIGLARWSGGAKKPPRSEIVWIDGGGGTPAAAMAFIASPADTTLPVVSQPEPEQPPAVEPQLDETMPVAARASDLELPPSPTPAVTIAPEPSPTQTPPPKMSATPQPPLSPSPKPTPKRSATPRPKPTATPRKTLLAKASPSARPRETVAPLQPVAPTPEAKVEVAPVPPLKDEAEPTSPPVETASTTKPIPSTIAKPGTGGSAGSGAGRGAATQFGWYSRMLHDRFFGAWTQPTTVMTTGVKMSTLVKLRIEKDGRVSSFEIVRSSGNVVVDESVAAVAKRVPNVDPLPPGLSDGPYNVTINFELRSE